MSVVSMPWCISCPQVAIGATEPEIGTKQRLGDLVDALVVNEIPHRRMSFQPRLYGLVGVRLGPLRCRAAVA